MITRTKPEITLLLRPDLSLEAVVRTIWHGRKWLLLAVAAFASMGVVVALALPPEFVSEAKIMPELGGNSGSAMKRLASVAGLGALNLANDDEIEAIRPDLYPNVLQSTPFILHLISQPVVNANGDTPTLGQFLLPDDQSAWSLKRFLGVETKAVKPPIKQRSGGPMHLSMRQKELIEDIVDRVKARLDTRSGVITITARMPDASIAASVTQLALDYLTRYVTDYRTEKARQDLRFYTQRLNEARHRYQTAQLNVFRYNDAHKHVVIQASTMDGQRKEAELTIAQTVYVDLSQQFERAKLTIQQQTPVFKILEPAQIPLERVSPKRTWIVLLFALAGW